MFPHSSADWIEFAGGVMMVCGVIASVFSTFFCVRYLSMGLRGWLLLAIAVMGTRLLTRDNEALALDEYWVAAIYVHLAFVMAIVAAYCMWRAMRKDGDRCYKND